MNDEEDKTTIESGWEEEASTTVEQGEVAEKLRSIGRGLEQLRRPNTNITSTNGGMSDEPTVDDQRAAAALAMLPPPAIARLVITAGNDSGQILEVRPGKPYTIGRGIDNDLVLTDIAVSRKHFDLRHDNGVWILTDRGSGNGTLVNRRIEDAPFTLTSGDVIEIGNTAFRFEGPGGVPRGPASYDPSTDDDLELSTVAGKPLREPRAEPSHQVAPMTTPLGGPMQPPAGAMGAPPGAVPLAASGVATGVATGVAPISSPPGEPRGRPKTLPPPRPRTQSGRPPGGYTAERPGIASHSQPLPLPAINAAMAPPMPQMQSVQPLPPPPMLSPPMPASTLPMPQMANRSPLPPAVLVDPPPGSGPTTLPGQGPPRQAPQPARLPFTYPRASEQQPQLRGNAHGQHLVVATALPGRDASATALVPPMSYANGQPAMMPAQAYGREPALPRRVKMLLGAVGLAVLAAVATVAIIKGTNGGPNDGPSTAHDPAGRQATTTLPTVQPLRETPAVGPAPTAGSARIGSPRPSAASPAPTKPDKSITTATPSAPTGAVVSPPASATTAPAATPPASPSSVVSSVAATSPSSATPKPATSPPGPATTAATAPAPRPDKLATAAPPQPSPATAPAPSAVTPRSDPPAATPPAPDAPSRATPDALATTRGDKRLPKHVENRPEKKPTPQVAPATTDKVARVEVAPATAKPDKKRGGRSTQDVKTDASALYRTKRFADAAALVTAALPSFSGSDSQELKSLAAIYSQLGKAYNIGMAPGTKPTDAFVALRRAISYDRDVGSAYISEIERVLVTVASKAALSYAAAKEYESAFQAVRLSESLGSQSPTNKSVRDRLEATAGELLRAAASEQASDPEAAKKKLRQIQGMVDTKSPLYAKATKQLSDLQ